MWQFDPWCLVIIALVNILLGYSDEVVNAELSLPPLQRPKPGIGEWKLLQISDTYSVVVAQDGKGRHEVFF